MLSNAYFVAKFRFGTAKNEPAKNLQIFEKCDFFRFHFNSGDGRGAAGRGADGRGRARGRRGGGGHARGGREPPALAVDWRRLAKFRQNVARFRLYRLRFLQENMRFAAFFKIYQILKLKFLKFDKILQILRHLQFFC